MIGSANAGQNINTAVYTPAASASDQLLNELFAPTVSILAKTVAEALTEKLRHNDKCNAQTHIDAVKDRIDNDKSSSSRFEELLSKTSSKGAERLKEWSENAADIDSDSDPLEAAAWRAALDEIVSGHSDRMFLAVKNLTLSDLQFLMHNTTSSVFPFDIPRRLISNEIYERRVSFSRLIRISLTVLTAITGIIVVASTFKAAFYSDKLSLLVSDLQFPVILICVVTASILFAPALSYRLSEFGVKLVDKIKAYKSDI